MDDQIYAVLGRKQIQLESQAREYDKLLRLLVNVLDGTVEPSRVTVDLNTGSWVLADKKECVASMADAA